MVEKLATRLYLSPEDQGRRLTLDELQGADALEGYRYELIHGRLEVSPLPKMPHEVIREWLARKLRSYRRKRPRVVGDVRTPARVFVPEGAELTAPETDVAAYRLRPDDRSWAQLDWDDLSPFLVIEIISPDTAEKDLVRNRELYRKVPTIREYWIVDPRASAERPSMTVYRKLAGRWQRPIQVPPGGRYTTPLLPGFVLVLKPKP